MATLYVASTETFVGKSATCLALLNRATRDGMHVGYMKPVSVAVVQTETSVIDEWMGHQTEEMRRRYRHLFPDQQRQAILLVFGQGQ